MKTLLQMIEEEGHRNNALKRLLDEGNVPSEEVTKLLDSDEYFKISANSVEFRFRTNLEILKSNHYLVKLVERYLGECQEQDRVPEVDLNIMKQWIKSYTDESEKITQHLVGREMSGYEASW